MGLEKNIVRLTVALDIGPRKVIMGGAALGFAALASIFMLLYKGIEAIGRSLAQLLSLFDLFVLTVGETNLLIMLGSVLAYLLTPLTLGLLGWLPTLRACLKTVGFLSLNFFMLVISCVIWLSFPLSTASWLFRSIDILNLTFVNWFLSAILFVCFGFFWFKVYAVSAATLFSDLCDEFKEGFGTPSFLSKLSQTLCFGVVVYLSLSYTKSFREHDLAQFEQHQLEKQQINEKRYGRTPKTLAEFNLMEQRKEKVHCSSIPDTAPKGELSFTLLALSESMHERDYNACSWKIADQHHKLCAEYRDILSTRGFDVLTAHPSDITDKMTLRSCNKNINALIYETQTKILIQRGYHKPINRLVGSITTFPGTSKAKKYVFGDVVSAHVTKVKNIARKSAKDAYRLLTITLVDGSTLYRMYDVAYSERQLKNELAMVREMISTETKSNVISITGTRR